MQIKEEELAQLRATVPYVSFVLCLFKEKDEAPKHRDNTVLMQLPTKVLGVVTFYNLLKF